MNTPKVSRNSCLLLVFLAISLIISACSKAPETAAKPAGPAKVKVGLVFDVGGRGDKSFNDGAFAGLEAARKELGDKIEIKYLEPAGSGENREQLLRLLAQDKYDLIFGVGFMFTDSIRKVAKDFSQTKFALIDGYIADLKPESNLTCLLYREHEGAFLVGAAAAMKTGTGKIGFIGGMQIPLIEKFETGYIAGARYSKPDIVVFSDYIGTTGDAFKDPVKGKELALKQIGAGADILFHASGASGLGVLEAVTSQKRLFIGVDSDQSLNASESQRPYILTSMLKRVDVAVQDTIRKLVGKTFQGGYQEFGLQQNGVTYADNEYNRTMMAPLKPRLEEIKAKIQAGEIKVPVSRKELK